MTATAIDVFEVPAQASYDELVEIWQRTDSALQWIRGDIAARVKKRMQDFAAAVGVSYKTLLEYRKVAEAYPPDSRRLEIAWSVHQALASQDDRAELVASRDDWTLKGARALISRRNRPEIPPPPAPEPVEEVKPEPPRSDEELGKPDQTTPGPSAPEPKGPTSITEYKTGVVRDKTHFPASSYEDAFARLRGITSQSELITQLKRELPVFNAWYVSNHRQLESDNLRLERDLADARQEISDLEAEKSEVKSSSEERYVDGELVREGSSF